MGWESIIHWQSTVYTGVHAGHRRRIKTETQKKSKGRRCCMGDRIASIPCRTSYFALYRTISRIDWIAITVNPRSSSEDLCLLCSIYPRSLVHCLGHLGGILGEQKEVSLAVQLTGSRPRHFVNLGNETGTVRNIVQGLCVTRFFIESLRSGALNKRLQILA